MIEKQVFSVINDLKMGKISGQVIDRHVKESHPDTRVFIITGNCDETDEHEAYQNEVNGFLCKPFSMNAILTCRQHLSPR